MIRTIAIAFILLCSNIVNAQTPALDLFTEGMLKFSSEFNTVKTLIKTDKNIYAPGENIWFDATVLNCLTKQVVENSNLIIMLKSESGEVIADSRHLVLGGRLSNTLQIPSWAPQGNVFFIAYASETFQNGDASLAAIQPLTITRLRRNNFSINLKTDKEIYKPGDNIRLSMILSPITPSGRRERVTISLHSSQNELFSKRENIRINEISTVNLKIPQEKQNGLYLVVKTSDNNSRRLQIPTTIDALRVVFFAEGGKFISNNTQRIVYRAFDPFGKPVNVSGKIYDRQNNLAGEAKPLKDGVGVISLLPMSDKDYFLKIESEYGNKQEFKLPTVHAEGVAITLTKTEETALRLAVYNSGEYLKQNLTLLAYASGAIYLSTNYVANTRNNFNIATQSLPYGLVTLAVINSEGDVLSKRLVYNPNPQPEVKIYIESNDEVANIHIQSDSIFSATKISRMGITVVDEHMLTAKALPLNYDFLKYPLISSPPLTVLEHFITNTELIANQYKPLSLSQIFQPETALKTDNMNNVSGTVYGRRNKPESNATVMMDHPEKPSLISVKSDEEGKFVFKNTTWHSSMSVTAVSENGRRTYDVTLDKAFSNTMEDLLLRESLSRTPAFDSPDISRYINNNIELLRHAGIGTETPRPTNQTNTQSLLQSGVSLLEVIRIIKPYNIVSNQIVFQGSINSLNFQQGALIVVDGQRMGTSINVLENMNPAEVASIKVSTNFADIQQYSGVNSVGVIEIKTHGTNSDSFQQKNENEEQQQSFKLTDVDHNIAKYQTTLLWNPDIDFLNKESIEIKVPLSQIQSNFSVILDITTVDGITFRETKTFSTVTKK